MNLISILMLSSCIVSGSVDRLPADAKTATAAATMDMRGVSSATAVLKGVLRTTPPGFCIVVR